MTHSPDDVIIARVTRSFFPIFTSLFLPTPFPNRLDCEQSAIPRRVKWLSARRPSAKPVLKPRMSARPVIVMTLEGYALPPARAALHKRVPKQRYDAALAAGPHALTLP